MAEHLKEIPAQHKCPKCGSDDVARKTGVVAVIDTDPPVVPWKCSRCGEEFLGWEFLKMEL